MPAGRPSNFSQKIADEICERVSQAESITSICKDEHMPNASTVFRWLNLHEEFSKNLARARETMADYISFQIMDIADEQDKDWYESKFGPRVNPEAVMRSKVRIDARVKLMQMLKPKTYGEKLALEHTGEIKTVIVPAPAKDQAPRPASQPQFDEE